jgi:DNA-binding response OmpR family regulator/anti-sigma regulatory factor (Ser/Thr protein kinase)
LDSARLESDTMDLQVQRVDLGAALQRIGQAFVGLAERRDVTFQRKFPDEMVSIAADPEQLETVIVNLLSNAFKYTPEGGQVTLALTFGDEAACIRVSDTGPGIPADEQADIFDRFHQSDTAQTTGTGIGLSLAQALVERHGGTIAVESTVGEGSTFTVRLPRGTAHLEDRPDVTWEESGDSTPGEPSDSLLPPVLVSSAEDTTQEGPVPKNEDRTTVLVVDDNADIRSYVRRHLAPTYRVVEAADGEEGRAKARDLTPDCIVSDVMMPRMDGGEMLRELRTDSATDFLPVIFLTAKAAMDDKLEGLDAGADDYLTKPFRPDELKTRIRNLIAQRMRLRERFREEGRTASDPSVEEETTSPFLKKVTTVIREHISDEDLTVSTLATEVGASRSKLYRKLGDATDASPAELIWQVRLDEARRLLRAGEGNVSEVAYGVGFKSVSHFTNRFRERFDEPPSLVVASSEAA